MLTGKYRSKMSQGFLFEVNTILRCNGNFRFKHPALHYWRESGQSERHAHRTAKGDSRQVRRRDQRNALPRRASGVSMWVFTWHSARYGMHLNSINRRLKAKAELRLRPFVFSIPLLFVSYTISNVVQPFSFIFEKTRPG